jgi:hypothetical protein
LIILNTFVCKNKKKTWSGIISKYEKHGTHYEILIQSRSSILVVFSKSSRGYVACMPDFGAGCYLSTLNDIFWNTERLTQVLGVVDGITVASALLSLQNELGYPEF